MIDQIICGDCLEELPAIPEDSIDAIVTDPPYELAFMGKKWDGTGIAYNRDMWAGCLRVLKPGGHLLAFGGTRTYHRMACAIEDAGFEIRDCLEWVYGSGFPKSFDISKALDKMAGAEREQGEPRTDVTGRKRALEPNKGNSNGFSGALNVNRYNELPVTDAAKQWSGWGSALKPAHEPIVLARKPLARKTIAENVLEWGCGGLNIDATRIATNGEQPTGSGDRDSWRETEGRTDRQEHGKNITPPTGRFPSNLIWSHSPLCKRIGTKKVKVNDKEHDRHNDNRDSNCYGKYNPSVTKGFADADGMETVESWDCHPSCPSWEFAKAGERKSGGGNKAHVNPGMWKGLGTHDYICDQSSGSASRFFKSCQFAEEDLPAFMYCAKASPSERNGSTHPTVKPLSLMRYLCRLITPPCGIVLDPFAGSGTTCLAAKLEGFGYIGIEKEAEYHEIAHKRIAAVPARLDRWAEAGP